MGRKGKSNVEHKLVIGNLADPDGIARRATEYLEWLLIKNYSERTVAAREIYLRFFITWCDQRGLGRPQEITRPILERYARHLYHYRNQRSGRPLSFRSQRDRLVPVRAFFKWLAQQYYLLSNPASELVMPKMEHRLPRSVLSIAEVEAVLSVPDTSDDIGLRDRALMELFYSTGIRRRELMELTIYDLDRERMTLMVRKGKGNKDRVVPVGERALDWTDKYQREVRPGFVCEPDEGILFLTSTGEAFTPNHLSHVVRKHVKNADIGKMGSCHLFRHTMATLMLEAGADVRFIQEMLGHASLESTQIYTHVSIRKLQQIHAATHPSAKRGRYGQEPAPALEEPLDAQSLLAAIADEDEDEETSETKALGENA